MDCKVGHTFVSKNTNFIMSDSWEPTFENLMPPGQLLGSRIGSQPY